MIPHPERVTELWHPAGVRSNAGRFPVVSAALRPPATSDCPSGCGPPLPQVVQSLEFQAEASLHSVQQVGSRRRLSLLIVGLDACLRRRNLKVVLYAPVFIAQYRL